MIKVITLDMLTKDSVSILQQEFNDQGKQVGYNIRNAYLNTPKTRELLKGLLSKEKWNELVEVWTDKATIEDVKYSEFETQITLDDYKNATIKKMSKKCNEVIIEGFDLILSDNKNHHFSLKIEDQLKIQALALKVKSGETVLPYHADNEPCRFYTPDEIFAINNKMEKIIEYQTTYFNSLKNYINNMKTIDEIKSVKYGMDVLPEFRSEVFVTLISEGLGND